VEDLTTSNSTLEVTLLPSESKEDFVYVDTQLNLSSDKNATTIEQANLSVNDITQENNYFPGKLNDLNNNYDIGLQVKRSSENTIENDDNYFDRKNSYKKPRITNSFQENSSFEQPPSTEHNLN